VLSKIYCNLNFVGVLNGTEIVVVVAVVVGDGDGGEDAAVVRPDLIRY
jgi:hypothetical protein